MRRLAATLPLLLSWLAAAAAPAAPAVPQPPYELPSAAGSAAAAGWIVGAVPSPTAAAVAQRHGAREVAPGTYAVPRSGARGLARELSARGLLRWAEPDRARTRRRVGADPLSPRAAWRDVVADPELDPPAVHTGSPLLALVDSQMDVGHPEFGGSVASTQDQPLTDLHGTATAAIAAAPVNGTGIVGVWPGMRALNVALPDAIQCSDSARGISRAIREGAAVINMSYGSTDLCYAEYVALQYATAAGIVPVAAAGNEFSEGNPLEYPASLPHVVTVAAVDATLKPAYFSNENAAIDLSAPGVGILTAVPAAFDPDGDPDGWAPLDGTSFAAPMVAAAVAWVRAARPRLRSDQVAQVVRLSARDLGRDGYDRATGFGLLDVAAALKRRPPPPDPQEPNEDVEWIDGSALGRADRPIWNGGRPGTLTALLDFFEDPVDVYRLRLPPRARVRVTVRPRFGDPDLAAYGPRARGIEDRRRRLATSRRAGRRSERVTFANRSDRRRTFYVAAGIPGRGRGLDSVYELRVKRLRAG